ncbi:MAG: M14 family zinc carboxypeptidase [bacterium]
MKVKVTAFVFFFSTILASNAFAAKMLVRVYFDDLEHLKTVVSQFDDVASWGGNRYADIVIESEQYLLLNAIAPRNEIIIPNIEKHMVDVGVLGVGGAYHTQEEVYAELDSIADAHPDICRMESIGLSIENRDIWALKISDNVAITEDEPRILYLGCHHAREVITVEVPLYIMFWLVDNYGTDSLATYLVDNREIWIVPLMNPDGREYVQNVGDWRKNRRYNGDGTYGVDLNRNYSYMWGYDNEGSSPNPGSETYRGTAGFSEPETQAIRDLLINYEFDACISYHSYGKYLLYPWGYIRATCPDDDIYASLADSMSKFNGYTWGPSGLILYVTNGDSDDWMYGDSIIKNKVFSMSVEVGTTFYPPASNIIPLCEENLQPALLVAKLAGNMRRILPPKAPTIIAMEDDEDGHFRVEWIPDLSDTVNLPVAYKVIERTGFSRVLDDAEAGGVWWNMEKFNSSTSRAHSGSKSYYGGRTNNRDARLTTKVALGLTGSDTLTFYTWYDIETDWDYAYVEVSTDGGAHFRSIPGNITTTYNPNGSNLGHGITGSSGGWVRAVFPLTAFGDSTILLRFRYKTDGAVLGEGIYIDDIYPVDVFDSSQVIAEEITDTYIDLVRLDGTYSYEVCSRDQDGQWGPWSKRESITVSGTSAVVSSIDATSIVSQNPVSMAKPIVFRSPGDDRMVIDIFDMTGRRIRTIEMAGSGMVSWDFRDTNGKQVSPGIYFVRFERENKVETVKIVLLR